MTDQSTREAVQGSGVRHSQRTALVTGAGGFLGAALVQEAVLSGYGRVIAVDQRPTQEWSAVHSGASSVSASVSEAHIFRSLLRDVHDVFHLAATSGGRAWRERHRAKVLADAGDATVLARAASEAGVERIVFASSPGAAELADSEGREARRKATRDPEAVSKLFAERTLEAWADAGDFRLTIARLHSLLGGGSSPERGRGRVAIDLVRRIVVASLQGDRSPIEIRSSGRERRAFLHVRDAAGALVALAKAPRGGVAEVGGDEALTLEELADRIESIVGIFLPRRRRRSLSMGPLERYADQTALQSLVGERARRGVDQALREMVAEARLAIAESCSARATDRRAIAAEAITPAAS